MNLNELKRKLTVETIFPVIVILFSILNFQREISGVNWPSIILSLIGVAGSICYFLGYDIYKKIIYFWILGQLVVVTQNTFDSVSHQWIERPLWSLTQFVSFAVGINLTGTTHQYGIDINVIAIIFFGFLKLLEMASLIGKRLIFYQFREDNKLGDIFPVGGTITKRVNLSGEKDWLLVKLDEAFYFANKEIANVIVKNKSGEIIKPYKKGQLIYFRMVNDICEVAEGENDKEKFPFVDWAICQ